MWTPNPAWTLRGATFVLWALAVGSAMVWVLKLGGGSPAIAVPVAAARQVPAADPVALARLLGSAPSAAAPAAVATLASRFRLLGVAAGVQSGAGAAVIAVDGKPPRSYRVGASLEEGVVLQSVRGREAVLASPDGRLLATLEVPAPTPAVAQSPTAAPR